MRPVFELGFEPSDADIDELGHVNNVVWVRWIQDIATSHWRATAAADMVDRYIWVIVRHEIDYLRSLGPGEAVTGRTWVGEEPSGARFDRHVEFVGAGDRVHVRARTTWAMLDRESGLPQRIRPEVIAPFIG